MLTQDDEVNSRLVSQMTVTSVCFSDQHLITCCLGVPPTPPVMVTYTYRQIRKTDTAAFCRDILCSKLYDCTTEDADVFAELFDAEVERVLGIHAPLQTRRRRRGKHDTRQLSDEARKTKLLRRRLKRRYRRTGQQSDRRAYRSACLAARDSIQRSRAGHIKDKLDAVSGDVKSTWRTAQSLLHATHKVVYDDADCQKLATKFSQFFSDKTTMCQRL